MSSPSPTPERAIYGFVMYLFSIILIVIYVVWAIVPEATLKTFGLTYWPEKHWVLSAPMFMGKILRFVLQGLLVSLYCFTAPIKESRTFLSIRFSLFQSEKKSLFRFSSQKRRQNYLD